MKILAIESSCDETACAIVENGRHELASTIASQVDEHKLYGGVVPEIASRRHIEAISRITQETLKKSNLSFKDIDALAVTYAPGLIGALLVGVNFVKGLSLALNLPIIPVHHLRSHIAANYITNTNLEPPFLCLIASGGHSHIVEVLDYTKFNIIGKTRDDAAGEAFDKAARTMGLSYPGGIEIDKIAKFGDDQFVKLPVPKINGSDYDFSFSGLKTAIINQVNSYKMKNNNLTDLSSDKQALYNFAASFRKSVVDILVSKFIKAAEAFNYKKLVLAGGVSANSLLREELNKECIKRNWELFMPQLNLCGDNATMVGAQAYYEYVGNHIGDLSLNAIASLSIEKI